MGMRMGGNGNTGVGKKWEWEQESHSRTLLVTVTYPLSCIVCNIRQIFAVDGGTCLWCNRCWWTPIYRLEKFSLKKPETASIGWRGVYSDIWNHLDVTHECNRRTEFTIAKAFATIKSVRQYRGHWFWRTAAGHARSGSAMVSGTSPWEFYWKWNYTVFQKSDAKSQITITTAHLIRIYYPLSSFNYRLSGTNVANFNKIHHIVSEQQLF